MKKWWSGVSGFIRSESSSACRSRSLPSPSGTPSKSSACAAAEVVADRLDRGRVVVVGLEIPADGLDDRRGALLPGRERELVRPDRLVAELLPVRAQPLVQEAAAALGALERADHVGGGLAPERLAELVVALDLLLHLPERLDRVPVPVLDRALQAAEERRVGLALHLRDGRVQRHRRGELREVEHPVDLPVTVVDVERVLEEHHELDQRGAVGVVPVQVGEVPLDLGAQPVTPPVEEVAGVVGQDEAQVRTHLRRVLGVVRDAGRVARLELVRLGPHGRVGRDRRRVEVAVHVLRHPVRRERRREAPEHVVASQPPPAQVEIERRQRVGAVEVVQHPEELRLAGLPLDRKRLVTLEGGRGPLVPPPPSAASFSSVSPIIDYPSPACPPHPHRAPRRSTRRRRRTRPTGRR